MEDTKQENEPFISLEAETPSEEQKSPQKASFFELYCLMNLPYKFLFFIGCISAFIGGFNYPMTMYVCQRIFARLIGTPEEIHDEMIEHDWYVLGIAGLSFVTNFIQYTCFTLVGKKIQYELRWRYIKSILIQDSSWYDKQNIESLPTIVHRNLKDIEIGCGRVIGFVIYAIGSFICGCAITLTLALFLFLTLLVLLTYMLALSIFVETSLDKVQSINEEAFINGGVQAEETINAIRVVKAFRQEKMCSSEFSSHLQKNKKETMGMACRYGTAFAFIESIPYSFLGYALLVGGFFVAEKAHNSFSHDNYTGGDIFSAFCFLSGSYFLGNSLRNIFLMRKGLEAAYPVLELIKRIPEISLDNAEAIEISAISEGIKLDNIVFKYPDSTTNALDGVSIEIKKGKTLAIVGPSGSGKSTIAKLLERFYDPDEGQILIDGRDLKTIDLRQYRNLIGYVGQEPCLFNETIRENLLNSNPNATNEDIVVALKTANAWEFVEKLDKGIDHPVGAVGSKLSGGQKQRIAIARALVRNPQILIFDEATSALDIESEKKVQTAIDSIGGDSITKVVIAHRLATVKNAEKIIVIDGGNIAEQGDHDELLELNKIYAKMTKIQNKADIAKESVSMKQSNLSDITKIETTEEETTNVADQNSNSEEMKLLISDDESKHIQTNEEEVENFNGFFFVLKEVLTFASPKCFIIAILIGSTLLGSALVLLPYPATKLLMSILINFDEGAQIKDDITKYVPIIFGLLIFSSVIQFFCRAMLHVVNINLTMNVRKYVYDNIIHQPLTFFDKPLNNTGNLTSVLASNVKELNGVAVEMYIFIFQSFTGMLFGIGFAFFFEQNMGLLFSIITPVTSISVGITFALQSSSQSSSKEAVNSQEKMISDYILNHITVSSLANEDIILQRYFSEDETKEIKYKVQCSHLYEAMGPAFVYGFGFSFVIFAVFMIIRLAAHNIIQGHSVEDQVMCLIGFTLTFLSVAFLMNNPPDFGKSLKAVKRIIQIMQCAKEGEANSPIVNGDYDLSTETMSCDIEFHNVWFKYSNSTHENWVLEGFSLRINEGESIGFIGESGCGKSTIIALLLRFYEPQAGYITIGGRKITDFTISSVRAYFGLVQQEPVLFNTTIMENICYGKPHATFEEIENAAAIANCEEFIRKKEFGGQSEDDTACDEITQDNRYDGLDEGYKTVCGSGGNKLSGGQKQRIAIARAIISQPKFLILDEATSALDENSQKEVQDALDKVTRECTSIVIAHRLSTLAKCDRIVTIESGVIVDDVQTSNN
ncbi:unnamed protein product [Moneuplotes crassus]|uniref:Uncharacterized protein n=1 Tax=Euplotes crassus TaxID=5936 RepID=A0AAD1UBK7_EUPCR|nr:unnamed protein product [Moneuplotes crassus]